MKTSAPIVLFLTSCIVGCTAWRLDPNALSTPVPFRKPLEIWFQERGAVVHGVEVNGDTVRAVPRWRPPECDTCAILFPLGSIDSVRSRRYSSGRTIGLVGGIVALLVLYGLTQIEPGLPAGPQ